VLHLAHATERLCSGSRSIRAPPPHAGKDAPGIYAAADFPARTALLQTRIQEFEYNHRGIYLGFTKLRRFKNPLKVGLLSGMHVVLLLT
jgi:hypothetical protein